MSDHQPRMYRFKTRDQWRSGLLECIEARQDGTLVTPSRYGRNVSALAGALAADKIAANSAGAALWQVGENRIQYLDHCGDVASGGPSNWFAMSSPRWVADRDSVWLVDVEQGRVLRLTLDSFDLIDTIEVAAAIRGDIRIRDIAGDGAGGVWVLLSVDAQTSVVRIDCHGDVGCRLALGHGACQADQVAYLPRSAYFVLRSRNGERLLFFNARGEPTRSPLQLGTLEVDWHATRLTDDGVANAVVVGHSPGHPTAQVFVIDAQGERIDGPLEPSGETGDPQWQAVRDVAARGRKLWVAADTGVFTFARGHSDIPEFQCAFLAPTLHSPDGNSRGGWLRAELDARLPRGAVIEAHFGWSKEQRVADDIRNGLTAHSMSVPDRRALVWSRIPMEHQRTYAFTADVTNPERTIAIPLFEATERFLWIELRIVAPPNSDPATLRELRVLYPGASLMERLPAIYSDARRDPTGTIRRIVGVLETTTQSIDDKIRGMAQLLDPERAPAEWLDYLASWLDLPWDAALPESSKRALLKHAAELIANRGTRAGLQLLLDLLVGAGNASFVDLAVDAGGARLGACSSQAARLPLLLAGVPRGVAVLGERTILGGSRIVCDPGSAAAMSGLSGLLRIGIAAPAEVRATLAPILRGVLDRFLPAGVTPSVRWRSSNDVSNANGESDVLDGPAFARVGARARVGRIALSGARINRLDDPGIHVRFRL